MKGRGKGWARISIDASMYSRGQPTTIGGMDFYDDTDIFIPQKYEYRPLWEFFVQYFNPRVDTEIYSIIPEVSEFHIYSLNLSAEVDEPSEHGKMENRLKLAEWLQGKVPEDQINSLLA